MFSPSYIISPTQLRLLMNSFGVEGRPFLWGIDYMARKAFFLKSPYQAGPVLWQMGDAGNCSALPAPVTPPSLRVTGQPTQEEYGRMFAKVRQGLMRGDSFLANLTARTRVECDATLQDIFLASRAPFKLLLGDEFVCFSPEPFVRIDGRTISTYPMKGTIDAALPDAARTLMDNYKEMCEHYTIVDLMRNDLNSVAGDVYVSRFRYIENITTRTGEILQTSSEIRGTLPSDTARNFGDIILPLLPAGSITGAPKPATVNLISQAEETPRGWYTGVFGYFDGRRMVTAVMIRCLQRDSDGSLYFHSGGGITVNSDCHEEYSELLTKIYLT